MWRSIWGRTDPVPRPYHLASLGPTCVLLSRGVSYCPGVELFGD